MWVLCLTINLKSHIPFPKWFTPTPTFIWKFVKFIWYLVTTFSQIFILSLISYYITPKSSIIRKAVWPLPSLIVMMMSGRVKGSLNWLVFKSCTAQTSYNGCFFAFFSFFCRFFIKNGKIKTAIENKRQIKTADSEIFQKTARKKTEKSTWQKKNGRKKR